MLIQPAGGSVGSLGAVLPEVGDSKTPVRRHLLDTTSATHLASEKSQKAEILDMSTCSPVIIIHKGISSDATTPLPEDFLDVHTVDATVRSEDRPDVHTSWFQLSLIDTGFVRHLKAMEKDNERVSEVSDSIYLSSSIHTPQFLMIAAQTVNTLSVKLQTLSDSISSINQSDSQSIPLPQASVFVKLMNGFTIASHGPLNVRRHQLLKFNVHCGNAWLKSNPKAPGKRQHHVSNRDLADTVSSHQLVKFEFASFNDLCTQSPQLALSLVFQSLDTCVGSGRYSDPPPILCSHQRKPVLLKTLPLVSTTSHLKPPGIISDIRSALVIESLPPPLDVNHNISLSTGFSLKPMIMESTKLSNSYCSTPAPAQVLSAAPFHMTPLSLPVHLSLSNQGSNTSYSVYQSGQNATLECVDPGGEILCEIASADASTSKYSLSTVILTSFASQPLSTDKLDTYFVKQLAQVSHVQVHILPLLSTPFVTGTPSHHPPFSYHCLPLISVAVDSRFYSEIALLPVSLPMSTLQMALLPSTDYSVAEVRSFISIEDFLYSDELQLSNPRGETGIQDNPGLWLISNSGTSQTEIHRMAPSESLQSAPFPQISSVCSVAKAKYDRNLREKGRHVNRLHSVLTLYILFMLYSPYILYANTTLIKSNFSSLFPDHHPSLLEKSSMNHHEIFCSKPCICPPSAAQLNWYIPIPFSNNTQLNTYQTIQEEYHRHDLSCHAVSNAEFGESFLALTCKLEGYVKSRGQGGICYGTAHTMTFTCVLSLCPLLLTLC